MENYKTIIYFRGKCYKNTFYNRVVARILTFSFRLKCLLTSLFVLLFFMFFGSCSRSSAKIGGNFFTDSVYTDSFGCNGHSYIRFRVCHTPYFQIVHNPDCYCRYHRTFVVIKKNK